MGPTALALSGGAATASLSMGTSASKAVWQVVPGTLDSKASSHSPASRTEDIMFHTTRGPQMDYYCGTFCFEHCAK